MRSLSAPTARASSKALPASCRGSERRSAFRLSFHLPLSCALLLLAAACGNSAPTSGHGAHSGHAGEAGHAGEHEHEEVVRLSPEALLHAGIRLGQVERRALTQGAAIPAQVQLEPSSTVHVTPIVSGRITQVNVALGDTVKAGQVLGVLASSDVSAVRSSLGQAKARLSAANSRLQRQQQLSKEGIGAQRALVDAQAEVHQLRAEVEGLERQLSVFGTGRVGELSLTTPIDGVVVEVHGTLGESAQTDQMLFVVTDPSRVWVRGNVPELEISRVQVGTPVLVRLHAFPELSLRGTLTYKSPTLDERTRSLPVRVVLDAPDPRLVSGLYGSIELLGSDDEQRSVVVPVNAVAQLDGHSVVFVPGEETDTFVPKAITLGKRAGNFFEVRAGLDEGSVIAESGAFTLKSVLRSSELSDGHAH